MAHRLAADAVLMLHAGFIAFVVFGLAAILLGGVVGWGWVRNGWFRLAHLAAIGLVVAQAWAGIACPLTVWENRLRAEAGESAYPGGFIAYWLHELIFYQAEPWVFTVAYTLFGLAVLASLFLVPVRWEGKGGRDREATGLKG